MGGGSLGKGGGALALVEMCWFICGSLGLWNKDVNHWQNTKLLSQRAWFWNLASHLSWSTVNTPWGQTGFTVAYCENLTRELGWVWIRNQNFDPIWIWIRIQGYVNNFEKKIKNSFKKNYFLKKKSCYKTITTTCYKLLYNKIMAPEELFS